MRIAICAALLFALAGCKPNSVASGATSGKDVLALSGPGGKVSLGDTPEQAKAAFPPPKGSMVFDTSMNFRIVTQTGWAWSTSKDPVEGFEAATKDGKIIALARTGGDSSGEPAKSIAELGQPTRKAEGKTVESYVWDSGDSARIMIKMRPGNPMMAISGMTLIGSKTDLAMLNYRADDPQTFVKQMDATSNVMNSPEMKKAVADARKKGLSGK